MDVVYSVGEDKSGEYFALKMALRSVERYAENVGKVVIAGYAPPWLGCAAGHVMVRADMSLPKQSRILDAVFAAIDGQHVSGEFLYSSDDHILTRAVDFDNYPYYYKSDALPTFDDVVRKHGILRWKGYWRSLTETRRVLEAEGYGIVEFCGHVNTHMDTRDAEEVKRMSVMRPVSKDGYEPTCLFMNVRQRRDAVTPTFREDCKLKLGLARDEILKVMESNETVSFEGGFEKDLSVRSVLLERFPTPSRYEK